MAYEVTATRRRPQNFNNLVGQEFVAETLKNSIESKKIAHAYLFSGPRGCGKTSTARILARALNCEKGPTANPCGECQSCKEIKAGSSLDVIEIDGASNNSVEGVRQIKDEVLFPPNSARYKIYIIDEVHMLTTNAFNALLKTIEEPPPYCIFIFATTELQKVPMTIKSRCQQFNFRLVPPEKVKEQLAQAAAELGIKAEDEALYWIAREATGSMRDSYTLFDQIAAFSGSEITYEKIRDKLGLVGLDRLNELFGLCVESKSDEVLLKLDEYMQNGLSIDQLISNCTDYLRSVLLIKNGVKKESLLGQSAERYNQTVINGWTNIQIERALSIFMQLYRDIRYSLSPRFEFELALSRLCWLKEYVSSAEVKKALDNVKPVLLNNAAPRKLLQQSENQQDFQSQKKNIAASQTIVENVQKPLNYAPNTMRSVPMFSALDNPQDDDEQSDSAEENYFDAPYNDENSVEPTVQKPLTDEEFINEHTCEPEEKSDTLLDIALKEVKVDSSSSIDQVVQAIVSAFSQNEVMVANALLEAENWSKTETEVSCTSSNSFGIMQLNQNSAKIVDFISNVYGKKMLFNVKFLKRDEGQKEIRVPKQVELVKNAFNGTLMGHI